MYRNEWFARMAPELAPGQFMHRAIGGALFQFLDSILESCYDENPFSEQVFPIYDLLDFVAGHD